MKKIVLSLAGALVATAFAPEASAVPAFARQTGMACSACHFQHFPVLNSFGRAFKASGYTMMGAQNKVEGEHLSIPETLNASVLLKVRYQKTNGTDPAGTISGATTNGGQWQFPDELGLFFGGRIAENVGFLMENSLIGPAVANGGMVAGLKVPFVYEMGGAKVSVTPYFTDSLGAFYGYDLSSTGQIRGIRWTEHRTQVSAQQFVGTSNGAATGLAFAASGDMGYISLSRFSPNFTTNGGGAGAVQFRSNALRIAATPTFGDWAMHIGAGIISGSNYNAGIAAPTAAMLVDTKGQNIDVQAQGNLGGKDTSIYFTWAKANASPLVGTPNLYNAGNRDKNAWAIGGEYSVIQHTAHIGLNYLRGDNGGVVGAERSNAFTVSGIYELAQNVELHLNYSKLSGNANSGAGVSNSLTTLMLETAF